METAHQQYDQAERARRQANEEAEAGTTGAAKAELQQRRRRTTLASTLTGATLELRRAELELYKSKQQVIELRRRCLQEKIRQLAANVVFSEDDLRARLKSLVAYESELRARWARPSSGWRNWEAIRGEAQETGTVEAPAAPPAVAKYARPKPSAETTRFARRLCQEEVAQLERRLAEMAAGRSIPNYRFQLANNQAMPEDLAAWNVSAEKLLATLADEEQLLAARTAELTQDSTPSTAKPVWRLPRTRNCAWTRKSARKPSIV